MTSPSQIKAYAAKYGVDFSVEGGRGAGGWSIECWSPQGKRWKATGTHFLAVKGDGYYTKPDWAETLADLKTYIDYGFEDCTDPECDVCCPELTD